MKKFLIPIGFLALAAIFVFWFQPKGNAMDQHQAAFVVDQKMYVNDGQGKAMDTAPFVHNSRVYVPVRYLGNALGIPDENIDWDELSRTVKFKTNSTLIKFTVDSTSMLVGEKERSMDVVPLINDGRILLPARWLAESLGYEVEWDEASQAVLIGPPGNLPEVPSETGDLPVVGTYENLKSILANLQNQNGAGLMVGSGIKIKAPAGAAQESTKAADTVTRQQNVADTPDYSKTNVQVEGVDEADIVKTDGSYIYQVNGNRVIIAKAYPAGEMKIIKSLNFSETDFLPNEMYVDDRYLIIIGQTSKYRDYPAAKPLNETSAKIRSDIYPPSYRSELVKAIIYDIRDKSNINQARVLELDGRYVSSRKIGQSFYLAANRNIYYYTQKEIENPRPIYLDTAVSNEFIEIDYPAIQCFPGLAEPNYLIVAGINLDNLKEKADINTFLGSGENIYASTKNLYVAVADHQYGIMEDKPGLLPQSIPVDRSFTKVYKFALHNGKITYTCQGEAPGAILNQFSMDEHNGYFRIATTTGDIWRTGEYTSKNNVYILDDGMKITGKLENIAPGEKIYSVRFAGNRCYLVTFKTVDPFFVIDLTEPDRPEILGALKIPGYSNYLHPYDENHIIGFGKDTIELGQKDANGNITGGTAFYTGMKMAVFDVTDVKNPVEMFSEKIGDRGTDSELLYNHKALLFSKENNLLAFPVSVMKIKGSETQESGFPSYGEFAFQGAYVYHLDLAGGFSLKGQITHLSDQDYMKAGNSWYDSEKNINRILYIKDVLYTLSGKYIKANSLDNLAEIRTLELK